MKFEIQLSEKFVPPPQHFWLRKAKCIFVLQFIYKFQEVQNEMCVYSLTRQQSKT